MERKILGIDLGVASIGWALVKLDDNHPENREIVKLGVRVIPLDANEANEFSKGSGETRCRQRTMRRGMRRLYSRYVMRRKCLTNELIRLNMFDPGLFSLDRINLWEIRSKAVTAEVTLNELGRVLYHLHQKRGYKSNRRDISAKKEDTDYVKEVKGRHETIKDLGQTIGQHFHEKLLENPYYRIRANVFPREAYEEECRLILSCQQKFHPDVLTNEIVDNLFHIIYVQRPLRSQKGLVRICEFEGRWIMKEGKEIFMGPRVAPRSSPLFQIEKIWENVNNIRLKNRYGEEYPFNPEERRMLYEFLNQNEKLTGPKLIELLGLKKTDGWYYDKMLQKGIEGNRTYIVLKNKLKPFSYNPDILRLNLSYIKNPKLQGYVDTSTGEVYEACELSPDVEKEPLYQLWHLLYSVHDPEECKNALMRKFDFSEQAAEELTTIDFTAGGYGNKSHRMMRRIIPYLANGIKFSEACTMAGYRHSFHINSEENLARTLKDKLELLPRNSLRQPIIEKVLNQLIQLVNEIMDEKSGLMSREERITNRFEIRIELARELKQNKEDRNETWRRLRDVESENKKYADELENLGVKITRNNIVKMRLFYETTEDPNSKINAICLYCGKAFGKHQAILGKEIDVEHILPRSLIFDDSQGNKILVHQRCNQDKDNMTAYDYMCAKGDAEKERFVTLVNFLHKNKAISTGKRNRLLMPKEKIDKDFIERQMRETQYISRKAVEILNDICFSVNTTQGKVTSKLRHLWGWDRVLLELQKQRLQYLKNSGLSEADEEKYEKALQDLEDDFAKRNDHRHHAIDALTIACTRQGFIQRINTLYSDHTRDDMYLAIKQQKESGECEKNELNHKLSMLEEYLRLQKPFTTYQVKEKAAEILVSCKPGKKVAVRGRNIVKLPEGKKFIQKNIIIPRGPLSEDSVYGKILQYDGIKPFRYMFANPALIVDEQIRQLVVERIALHQGDIKKALQSVKKEPLTDLNGKLISEAHCYRVEYVIRKSLDIQNFKKVSDIEDIVDEAIQQKIRDHILLHGGEGKMKEALSVPVYSDENHTMQIRAVRIKTGLKAVVPVSYNDDNIPAGFVKPGNNHHIAIYADHEEKLTEHICSFWHAVERYKYGLPVIIHHTDSFWDAVMQSRQKFPDAFLEQLPPSGQTLKLSIQANEYFLLYLPQEKAHDAIRRNDIALLSHHLFRVYNISKSDYNFAFQFITMSPGGENDKVSYMSRRFQSISALIEANPIKVRINRLGNIEL